MIALMIFQLLNIIQFISIYQTINYKFVLSIIKLYGEFVELYIFFESLKIDFDDFKFSVLPDKIIDQTQAINNVNYYYHGDHLGSSNYVTDKKGRVFEHTLYLPYGETWVDEGSDTSLLGYKFTGKELDEETNLYYFGARYYDPKISNWISTDPAFGDYMPQGKDVYFPEKVFDAKKLKGAGGVFNSININVYHYAGLNPLKYVDPDGNVLMVAGSKEFQQKVNQQLKTLKGTATGAAIIKQLESSKNVFIIAESAAGYSEANPSQEDKAQNGLGSGGLIVHDPKWTPEVKTPQGDKKTKPEVVLGHELSHAKDYDKGTLDRSVNPKTGNRRSEENAMKDENKIRIELKEPVRIEY